MSFSSLSNDRYFQKSGVLERSLDLVGLWEKWCGEGLAALLESGGPPNEAARWSILAGFPSEEVLESQGALWYWKNGERGPLGGSLEDWMNSQAPSSDSYLPFPWCLREAWFGVWGYEWGQPDTEKDPGPPTAHFFKPARVIAIDRLTREYFLMGDGPFEVVERGSAPETFRSWGLRAGIEREKYEGMVRKAQVYIAQGDIYQANLAHPFEACWEGQPSGLYRLIRELNPGPFMGIFKGRGCTIVSSSPERLILGRGDLLETKPIAGTRPRDLDEVRDLQLREELRTNPKERAEHLMLVDLARNDLGRVSRFGTVEVNRFSEVEAYSKVQHLVSTVRAQKKEEVTFSQVLHSLFPGGTITGCPKVRCMEIIRELEGRPRGYYTGSLGYFGPGPIFDLNILIRTFTLFEDGTLEFLAGAGVVADSDPGREYQETLYKVQALAKALGADWEVGP
ncbi:MAG TPA: anthranilate synthase component I family protein [bacterium]|nr:anthranilate synthase component I family protein [bacterium]